MINENAYVSVYKYENYKFDQPFLSFPAKKLFSGKSKICVMTEFSGALDNLNIDDNTILLECEDNKNVYISGLEFFEFRTRNKIKDYIYLMGNNMIPYVFAVGSKYTYFISTHYKIIENDKIENGMFLNSSNGSLDPYDYHLETCGPDCFKKLLECNGIRSSWLDIECGFMEEIVEDKGDVEDEEDVEVDVSIHELEYTDGSNEVVKFFNRKYVICLERDSDYKVKQGGHQCICEQCYQDKGIIDILKSVNCRT